MKRKLAASGVPMSSPRETTFLDRHSSGEDIMVALKRGGMVVFPNERDAFAASRKLEMEWGFVLRTLASLPNDSVTTISGVFRRVFDGPMPSKKSAWELATAGKDTPYQQLLNKKASELVDVFVAAVVNIYLLPQEMEYIRFDLACALTRLGQLRAAMDPIGAQLAVEKGLASSWEVRGGRLVADLDLDDEMVFFNPGREGVIASTRPSEWAALPKGSLLTYGFPDVYPFISLPTIWESVPVERDIPPYLTHVL